MSRQIRISSWPLEVQWPGSSSGEAVVKPPNRNVRHCPTFTFDAEQYDGSDQRERGFWNP